MQYLSQRGTLRESPLPYFSKTIFLILCSLIATGCAVNIPLYQKGKLNDSKKFIIANVPFIAQKDDYCGPASLAMIFNFWRIDITQDEIAREVYSPELKGTLSIEMVLYAIKNGFEVEMYNGGIEDLKNRIKAGFPLIVSHRTDKENKRVHYLVAWGFNDNKGVIYVHSGVRENLSMDYQTFLKYWEQAENLTFFIHPKDKVYVNTNN